MLEDKVLFVCEDIALVPEMDSETKQINIT